jgi:hypothetical protein
VVDGVMAQSSAASTPETEVALLMSQVGRAGGRRGLQPEAEAPAGVMACCGQRDAVWRDPHPFPTPLPKVAEEHGLELSLGLPGVSAPAAAQAAPAVANPRATGGV